MNCKGSFLAGGADETRTRDLRRDRALDRLDPAISPHCTPHFLCPVGIEADREPNKSPTAHPTSCPAPDTDAAATPKQGRTLCRQPVLYREQGTAAASSRARSARPEASPRAPSSPFPKDQPDGPKARAEGCGSFPPPLAQGSATPRGVADFCGNFSVENRKTWRVTHVL